MNRTLRSLTTIRPSLPDNLPAAGVLVGDLTALFVLTVVGLYRHRILAWEYPVYTLDTFAPFLIAWLVVAPLAGVYDRRTLTSYRRTLALVTGTWIVASVLGSMIRTQWFIGDAPLTFILVYVGFGTLFLLPWRFVSVWGREHLGQ